MGKDKIIDFAPLIVLIGLMGAGKTTLGKALAEKLGSPFCDADDEIVRIAGKDIPLIFDEDGEPHFRAVERDVITASLNNPEVKVLSTGGGAVMTEETAALIFDKCLTVWVRADVDTLVKRTMKQGGRPLLERDDPRIVLGKLLEERSPVYARADIVVDTSECSVQECVQEIMDKLRLA